MPRRNRSSENGAGHGKGLWSGTVSFGLVSIPVTLLSGARTLRVALRMLADDGTPLRRRYACSKEDKVVEDEHLVRGFEVSKGKFVIVTDAELEALAPEKSRDIDLRRFVKLAEIPAIYFERPYHLVPAGGSSKAYRLLAQTMEESGLAGIATFVMHEREYLAAILAERGLLRLETLRFADEIRSPAAFAPKGKTAAGAVSRMKKAIAALEARSVDPRTLVDRREQRLIELIAEKDRQREDVVEGKIEATDDESNVIDLMQHLKKALAARPRKGVKPARKARAGAAKSQRRAAA